MILLFVFFALAFFVESISDFYLLDVFAVDEDDPTTKNGQIEYDVGSGGQGQFKMHVNGSFYTAPGAQFDFDLIKEYTVIVSIFKNFL